MGLRKGMRVQELTKRLGQGVRHGVVIDIRGRNVRVQWDDGRMTSLSGAYLVPEKKAAESKSN